MKDSNILRQEYLQLVNIELPSIAIAKSFPVHLNHCFCRICLDNLFGGCWYNFLVKGRTPAYKQLSLDQLQQIIYIAQSIIDKDLKHINSLNNKSLAWRKENATRI